MFFIYKLFFFVLLRLIFLIGVLIWLFILNLFFLFFFFLIISFLDISRSFWFIIIVSLSRIRPLSTFIHFVSNSWGLSVLVFEVLFVFHRYTILGLSLDVWCLADHFVFLILLGTWNAFDSEVLF